MVSSPPRQRILLVGGNAVSAFLSWRLQATNSCDVTLVWKSGLDAVSQYGISFKSTSLGNERFKPRHGMSILNELLSHHEVTDSLWIVVKTPEEAVSKNQGGFDYVLLCVKALPDVYDLASVIESVVTPQHTCIIINTTNTLGVEAQLEARFPNNVILSLVSGAEITQLGTSEFEHKGSTEIWIGPANKHHSISTIAQTEMAQSIARILCSGQVDCHQSKNIRQQQYERMIGPIAFHPLSVIFDTPSHSLLIEKVGVRAMIQDILDELLTVATAQNCSFASDFKERTIEDMIKPNDSYNTMFQDFSARRPIEIETYLGSPIKLAQITNVRIPRIETLYAILHNMNYVNQQRKDHPMASPNINSSNTRLSVPPVASRMINGGPPTINGPMPGHGSAGRGRGRAPSMNCSQPVSMRRGPTNNGMSGTSPNGYPRSTATSPSGGYPQRNMSRRGSLEGNDLEEFSHLVLYDDIPESGEAGFNPDSSQIALRERELALRQRELALREHEMRLRVTSTGSRAARRGPPTPSIRNAGFDDDDEDDYFDPADGPPLPLIDPDNFDMMSVTSRRHRKATPNQREIRKNPEIGGDIVPPVRRSNGFSLRQGFSKNRSSARITSPMPGNLHVNLMDDNLLGYSSNRYGNVDRAQMGLESRSNSLTAARLDELQSNGGITPAGSVPHPRRMSNFPPGYPGFGRGGSRKPSPPNGHSGMTTNRKPSPPGASRQTISKSSTGQNNTIPFHVEQYAAGVSALIPPKGPVNFQSLTGSASASAGSTDSANIDSEPSANSSQSSLGHRPPIGVR